MEKTNHGQSGLLGRARIAAPCPTSWDAMEGDDRVRFCGLCQLNVYNLSAMTRAEAEALVARTEGRVCARLYRRADGTVLTKDCPTGLRAVRRRVRRKAAAVFALVASLWTAAAGQTQTPSGKKDAQEVTLSCAGGGQLKMKRKPTPAGEPATLSGVAQDPTGAVIVGVLVTLTNEQTKKETHAVTDAAGAFSLALPALGTYTLQLAAEGFAPQEVKGITVAAGESLNAEFTITMALVTEGVLVGILDIGLSPTLDRDASGKTVFDMKTMSKLPIP
jgi:hypothetical protein